MGESGPSLLVESTDSMIHFDSHKIYVHGLHVHVQASVKFQAISLMLTMLTNYYLMCMRASCMVISLF